MPRFQRKHHRCARRKTRQKRKTRKSRKKTGYRMKSTNPTVLTTVPRGLPRGPDSLFPKIYKTCLHTRIVETFNAGITPATAAFLTVNLNKAGNPYSTSYAYGVSIYAAQAGVAHDPGSINRDTLNLFNYYKAAYVTYAVVRATFIPQTTAAGSAIPSLVALTPGCDGDVDIENSFALQSQIAGGTLANMEEIPGMMMGISNQSIADKCTTLQRGYRMKTLLGAPHMIGDREYASEYDRGNQVVVAPSYAAKMAVIQKDINSGNDPVETTWVIDVYQVTLFCEPRTRDLTRNAP